jgi:hydroxymethylpyrimidine pyrophosphatase-like HAD family hydrolase
VAIDARTDITRGGGPAPRPGREGHYATQLATLADTYQEARRIDIGALASALAAARQRQTTYVGSGGALGVARLAAELHEVRTLRLARAATPLELIGMPALANSAVVLFSAGARHPDAAAAAVAALRSGAQPVVLVTHRDAKELARPFGEEVEVVSLPGMSGREGFLATNSVLAMSAATVAASGYELAPGLPNLRLQRSEPLREQTIILAGPGMGAVATDLETRLSETGLSAAQVTDYRNFAHGRHTGLSRRLGQTTILALIDPTISELAERTLAVLPPESHIVRLQSGLTWPMSTLDLLVGSMNAIFPSAEAHDFDPGRPRVPNFGRRLYHLSSRGLISPAAGPVERKLSVLGVGGPSTLIERYREAAEDWLAEFRGRRFGGFVFDYDGTVCATDARFELPGSAVREELLRLLEGGATIGFASGRGGSIHRDLRRWVPAGHWPQVELGLYNGGMLLRLDEPLTDRADQAGPVGEALTRIEANPLSPFIEFRAREHQLAIRPERGAGITLEALRQMAQEMISIPPALPLKVTASGHSIDVVPADSAKTNTLEIVRSQALGEVVGVGDQGPVGGNDFELLAATRWSLSVDRVSGDPSRCWNLDARGERGPDLLHRYLRSFRRLRGGFAYRPQR